MTDSNTDYDFKSNDLFKNNEAWDVYTKKIIYLTRIFIFDLHSLRTPG